MKHRLLCPGRLLAKMTNPPTEAEIEKREYKVLDEENDIETLRALAQSFHQRYHKSAEQVRELREIIEWIACASRDEIEDMLANSVCDDADDLQRYVLEKIALAPKEPE